MADLQCFTHTQTHTYHDSEDMPDFHRYQADVDASAYWNRLDDEDVSLDEAIQSLNQLGRTLRPQDDAFYWHLTEDADRPITAYFDRRQFLGLRSKDTTTGNVQFKVKGEELTDETAAYLRETFTEYIESRNNHFPDGLSPDYDWTDGALQVK